MPSPSPPLRLALVLAWAGIAVGCAKLAIDLFARNPTPDWARWIPMGLGAVSIALCLRAVLGGASLRSAAAVFVSALGAVLVIPLAYYALAAAVFILLVLALVNG